MDSRRPQPVGCGGKNDNEDRNVLNHRIFFTARLEKYKKRKEEREAKKTHAAEELTPEQLQNKKMVQAVIMNENIKSQDRNMLIEKANNLTREQIEELEQADKETKKGGK